MLARNRQRRRNRTLRLESLENRQMMAANVYLDFGQAFEYDAATGNYTFENYAKLYGEANEVVDPEHYNFHGFDPTDSSLSLDHLDFLKRVMKRTPEHLNASLLDTLAREQIDYNQDGRVDQLDSNILGEDVANLMRRMYEPFDVQVEIVASSNRQDVLDQLAQSDTADAYIFVAGQAARDGEGNLKNYGLAWFDEGNLWDNVATVAADDLAQKVDWYDQDYPDNTRQRRDFLVTSLANIAAHEAAHTFGLYHIGEPDMSSDNGDFMQIGENWSDSSRRFDLALATRGFGFEAHHVNAEQDTYEVLADALGLTENGPAYVTGTGGDDVIQIVGIGGGQAQVMIESYQDDGTLNAGGSTTYTIDITGGVLVEAGRGDDQVMIAGVDAPVEVRGGAGDDILQTDSGDDILQGDEGYDTLLGHQGDDTYSFTAPFSWDLGDDKIIDYWGADDTLDFAGFQHPITLDLADTSAQEVDQPVIASRYGLPLTLEQNDDSEMPDEHYLSLTLDNFSLNHLVTPNSPLTEYYLSLTLDSFSGAAGVENVIGTSWNDEIYGDSASNMIDGRGGDDVLYGRDGRDTLRGGDGEDKLVGGDARDYLFGDAGLDLLFGDGGDDLLDGGKDDHADVLTGGSGRDEFFIWYGHERDEIEDLQWRWDVVTKKGTTKTRTYSWTGSFTRTL
ncbi:MAG: hypothetical protein KY475_18810 [Planctomycetes bacterium]|nr:hypothetical protein [Planctomycetota bacterium]